MVNLVSISLCRNLFKAVNNCNRYHSVIMSQARYVFHIYGNSNIHKFLPIVKSAKSDPAIKNATYTRVTNSIALMEELTTPATCHNTIIISALTNIITSSQFTNYDTLAVFANKTFTDVLGWITAGREYLEGFAAKVMVLALLCLMNVVIVSLRLRTAVSFWLSL